MQTIQMPYEQLFQNDGRNFYLCACKTDGAKKVASRNTVTRLMSDKGVPLAQLFNGKRSSSLGHNGRESFARSLICSPFSHSHKNLDKTN